MQLVVRTQTDPDAFATTARQRDQTLDAELPLNNPTALATLVAQSLVSINCSSRCSACSPRSPCCSPRSASTASSPTR